MIVKLNVDLNFGDAAPANVLRSMANEAERKAHGHKYSNALQRGLWETIANGLRREAERIQPRVRGRRA